MMPPMNLRRPALASLVMLALAAGWTGCASTPPPSPPIGSTAPTRPSVYGTWIELWNYPGESDLDYQDQYKVDLVDGKPTVEPYMQEHPDEIVSVNVQGDNLDLVIHTSFDVHYQLRLDADGASMTGTATTPERVIPIRWNRVAD